MEFREGCWSYDGQAADRLWNKSALGWPHQNGILQLTSSELLFCHKYRHIDLPSANWLMERLSLEPNLIDEFSILEALRMPGNRIVLHNHLHQMNHSFEKCTWGLRWDSNSHPRNSDPVSEIRWFRSSDSFDPVELIKWSKVVEKKNRIAEILIVDEEQAVVTYNLSNKSPKGQLIPPSQAVLQKLNSINSIDIGEGNHFFNTTQIWPVEQLGIPMDEGRFLDSYSVELIQNQNSLSSGARILSDLLSRGLHPRPGFKYGTRWRCYDQSIGQDHAPWLISDPNEKSMDWGDACLTSRLSSGVNKIWLYPVEKNGIWEFLAITRPPANARWNNPIRK